MYELPIEIKRLEQKEKVNSEEFKILLVYYLGKAIARNTKKPWSPTGW